MKKTLLILIFISTGLLAQVEHSHGIVPSGEFPGFFLDAANFKGKSVEKTRVDIFLQVPYSNLQFIKTPKGFSAEYTVSLIFYDKDKDNIILERLWNEKISADNFVKASSSKNYKFSYRSFELPPGDYVLRCNVLDKDSKKDFTLEAKIKVAEFNKEIQFSDIIFIFSERDGQIIPNVSNTFASVDSTLYFYFEIYTEKKQSVSLEFEIKNKEEEILKKEIADYDLVKGANQIKYSIDASKASLGVYKLSIKVRDEDWDVLVGMSKPFTSKIYGFPAAITDLEKAVEQMIYIANNDEIYEIEGAENYEAMLTKFKEFWKTKDPSPNTTENEVLFEYYRRVAYANKHFKHYFEGWKTDMGMIYIVLGPPNNVERHPFEFDQKPYEIWDYYDINQRFVFVDETGFGDYRMLNNKYGDWYRYRQ